MDRRKFKGQKLYERGNLERGSHKIDLAMRFLGGPPNNMKEFAKFTEQIFGVPLHLKTFSSGTPFDTPPDPNSVILKFCTLENTIEFMDNPHIKRWKENYGINHMDLCEIIMGKIFGGTITELHVRNYIVGKVGISRNDRENLARLTSLYSDFISIQYQTYLEDQLIKRGEGPQ